MGHQRERQPQRLRGEREVRRRDPLEAGAFGHHRARHQHLLVRLRVEELEQRGEAARHLRRHARHVRHRLHVLRDDREEEEHRRHHLVPRAVGLDVDGGGGGGDGVGALGALAHLGELASAILGTCFFCSASTISWNSGATSTCFHCSISTIASSLREASSCFASRKARAPACSSVVSATHARPARCWTSRTNSTAVFVTRTNSPKGSRACASRRVLSTRAYRSCASSQTAWSISALCPSIRAWYGTDASPLSSSALYAVPSAAAATRALEGGVDRGGAAHDEERLGDDHHHALELVGAELGELRLHRLRGGLLGGGGLGGRLVGGGATPNRRATPARRRRRRRRARRRRRLRRRPSRSSTSRSPSRTVRFAARVVLLLPNSSVRPSWRTPRRRGRWRSARFDVRTAPRASTGTDGGPSSKS